MAYIGSPAAPTLAQVSDNTVTSAKIVDGTIATGDIADGAVTTAKLAAGAGLPDAIDVNASAPADSVAIDASGRVGIGTSSPSAELHVKAASGFAEIYCQGSGSTSGMYLYDQNTEAGLWKVDSGYIAIGTNNTERMRILSSGGITFNGDTAAANALDDYEEGTWTPVFKFGGAATGQTYGYQNGWYTKIGNRVYYSCYVSFANKGSSTGNATLEGLPFSTNSATVNYASVAIWINSCVLTAGYVPTGYIPPNANYMTLQYFNAGNVYVLNNSNFGNQSDAMIMGHYFV